MVPKIKRNLIDLRMRVPSNSNTLWVAKELQRQSSQNQENSYYIQHLSPFKENIPETDGKTTEQRMQKIS